MSERNECETMMFESDDHQTTVLQTLKDMYDQRLLVDITLCVNDREFPTHKNILAAISPYFTAMFTTDLSESRQQKICLFEVEADALALIINYAYTGRVDITRNNAQNLLGAASLFQISTIQEACAKFMESQFDISNCIGIHCFAQIHDCGDLRLKSKEYIEKNFTEVMQGEEFVSLSPEKMEEFLSSNELNVECEDTVYEALVKWVDNDKENRQQFMEKLLPLVRFGLLSPKFVQGHIAKNEMVQNSPKCRQILENAKIFETNPEKCLIDQTFSVVLRSGMIKPDLCLLLIGGVEQSRPAINCYNPLTRETYYIADFQDADSHIAHYDVEDPASVVTPENLMFVAGGNYVYRENYLEGLSDEDSLDEYDTGEETVRRDVYQYDNDHDTWIPRAPMLFPKSNFSLAYSNGKLYCFGGLTVHQHPTEIVESYDIAMNRWNYVCMMPTKLVDLTTVTLNGVIYIMGGRTGVGAHNVVIKFDPSNVEWSPLAGMPTPRFNFGACVVDNEIFIAGGQIYSHSSHTINREALSSVEIYNIEQNQWRQGPELPVNMYNVGLCFSNGSIYACGTTEHQRSAYRIFRYNVVYQLDLASSVWKKLEGDICDIRDFACVAAKLHTRKLSQVFRPDVDT
ncbi:kelch-like protein 7 [Lineus longissimus]|uniref:kelch-like protein 7 n=1 Tax=Lineus longissimus TaxID=88925 RepID=UPI002B4DFC7A